MKVYTIALGLYLLMGERNSCVPSQRVGATAVELKGCVVGSPFITEQQCLHRREGEDCSMRTLHYHEGREDPDEP